MATTDWLPLESNPDLLNGFLKTLGLKEGTAQFNDVFGLDEELLMMVPQPCVALCLLYPSKVGKPRRGEQKEKRAVQPQPPADLVFCMQHDGIGNACGTIACVHAIANTVGMDGLDDGPLKKFLTATEGMAPAARGTVLQEAKDMQTVSDGAAASGETEGAGTNDAQDQHFIAFVSKAGMLYELDGRNIDAETKEAFPFCHGATSAETFLMDAARVIREDFMARDPDCINFNVVALCKE